VVEGGAVAVGNMLSATGFEWMSSNELAIRLAGRPQSHHYSARSGRQPVLVMLMKKCPAWSLNGKIRRIRRMELVRAVTLLAGMGVAAAAGAQHDLTIEMPMPLAIEDHSAPLGQQAPVLEPGAPAAPTTSAPGGVFSPTTTAPSGAPQGSKHRLSRELTQQVAALVAKKEIAKAIAAIDEALKTASGTAELHLLRARVHCHIGNRKLCLEDADRGVASDLEYSPARLYRATVLLSVGRAKDAVADCDAVIKLQSESPLGHNCRGVAHRGLREFSRAIADFDEALRRDGKFAIAHYNKGMTYILQNQFKDAIASLTAAIDINPKHDDSFAQRGKAHISLDDVASARADYAKALSLNRGNIVAAAGMQGLHVGKALDALATQK
jgi:tetratricopeptide (TPR) repeat protein